MWRFHTGKEVPTYVFDDRQAKDRRVQTGWALQSTSMPRMWRWENDRYSPLCYLQHIKNDSSAFLNSDGGVLLTGILDNGECLSVRSPCRDYRLAVNRTIKRTKRIWLNWPTRPGSKMRLYSNLLKVRGSQEGEDLKIIYLIQSTFRLWPQQKDELGWKVETNGDFPQFLLQRGGWRYFLVKYPDHSTS